MNRLPIATLATAQVLMCCPSHQIHLHGRIECGEVLAAVDAMRRLAPEGAEWCVLIFQDKYRTDALRQLGRWATAEDVGFSWWDAAKLSQDMRKMEGA